MIAWFSLRLALSGGRQALLRLAFIAVGVGVGTTLLLLTLTAIAAAHSRDARAIWTSAAYAFSPDDGSVNPPPAESADGALFLAVTDYHDGERMTRAYVAALGADPPVPPGLDRLPGPGEVAASPAMRELLESTPDDQLDDRFPGDVTMTIGPAGLAHENQRVALIGRTPEQLEQVRSVSEVRAFDLAAGPRGLAPAGIVEILLAFGALWLLVPVVLVTFMVTRVAWAQREQRLAAIRLVGATRMQAARIAGMEIGLGAFVGVYLGYGGYQAGRRIAAETLVFQGGRFWAEDLILPSWLLTLTMHGTVLLVLLAPSVSAYWVRAEPLAASRSARRRTAGARTVAPALATLGAAALAAGVGGTTVAETLDGVIGSQLSSFLTQLAILGYVVGFVLTGPWLCLAAGKGIARLSRGAAGLVAARRIAADPYAAFRGVSVVVLAVAALTFLGSIDGQATPPDDPPYVRPRPGVVVVTTGGVPESQVAPLLSPEVVVVRARAEFSVPEVPCRELARVRYTSCPHPDGAVLAEPEPDFANRPFRRRYIHTDGERAAENRVRVQAANLVPNAIINTDRDPADLGGAEVFVDFGRLVAIASLFVLLLATVGLTAGQIGGLLERRRPFALLRASGVRIGELRRIVFLETAATMVVTSVAGIGLGMLLAYTATRPAGRTWTWPDPAVYAYAAGAVAVTLALSTFTLPLLNLTTRHNAIRYE